MKSEFSFSGKKILILGLARQGLALARFFVGAGARVMISDAAPATKLESELKALGTLPVELTLGGHPPTLLDDCDLLCISGGVPPQIEIVQSAIARHIPLSNDSLLTCQLARHLGLGPLVAITGSSGKTTTTTLVGNMLAESGRRVHVGGNIGTPLLDQLDAIRPGDVIVIELSSFQLELFDPALAWGPFEHRGPDVAAILNITPNHLDRHPNMTAYVQAKLNLLSNLPPNATVVLSLDDPVVSQLSVPGAQATHRRLPREWRLGDLLPAARTALTADKTKVVCFSTHASLAAGACLVDDHLFYAGQPICHRSEVKLRGEHNLGNLLAAAAISGAAGASLAAMNKVASTFAGVPHRLEVVAQAGGVTWINDSIATSPERALAGLRSFERGEQTLTLLAGGKDKNLLWDSLADEVLNRVDYLIGFGQVGPMFVNLVQQRGEYTDLNAPNCAVVQRLDEAVELAARAATPGTVVLLSPGGTSYDAYKDFEERGAHFRQLVAKYVNENWQSGSQLEKTGKSTH